MYVYKYVCMYVCTYDVSMCVQARLYVTSYMPVPI